MTADELEKLAKAIDGESVTEAATRLHKLGATLLHNSDRIIAALRLLERIEAADVELRDATGLSVRQCAALAARKAQP
jgi:hypothetical protein